MSVFIDILIIVFSFILFGVIHSILASLTIKKKIAEVAGTGMAFYRLIYNLFSIVILYQMFDKLPRPDIKIYDLNAPFDLLVLIPQFLGLAGLFWSLNYICVKEFLGINQVIRYFKGAYNPDELDEQMTFRVGGPYRFTRHPLYFFVIVILVFRPVMDLFYLTSLICIIAYFYIGSVYEERKLEEMFGEDYIKYKKEVPRIIPLKVFSPYKISAE